MTCNTSTLTAGEFKTKRGVKFTVSGTGTEAPEETPAVAPVRAKITVPYGIPCVRELFRFLISLVNPHNKQNTDLMIHVGLNFLLVTLKNGVDFMSKHSSLLSVVKNELCKNPIALLSNQRPLNSVLASSAILLNVLRNLLLLFDSLRHVLKFQLEVFFTRLGKIIKESGPAGLGTGSAPSTANVNGAVKWT